MTTPTPNPTLSSTHQRTYEKIFHHPVAHNLDWRDVRSLLERIGEVTEAGDGRMRVTRNGQTQVFPRPRAKEVTGIEEMMALRHFLERSEIPASAPEAAEGPAHWLVVIDHHEARVFRSETRDAIPQRILPHQPEDYFRHAHNSKDFSRGQEKPDPNSFFAPVAQALKGGGKILLLGSGKGTGSEMEQFSAWLAVHHPELARQIIGRLVVDQHHLTEAQILAKAREHYRPAPVAG